MSYLNQENVYSVASVIYSNIKQQYGVNIEGYYLEDIQKVMGKLFEKNKEKFGKNPRQVSQALNKKTVELVLPQVVRNIQEGSLNKTQNAIFKPEDNPMDAFERLKKEREREGQTVNVRNNGAEVSPNYSAPLQNQKNIYSGNNYQNRDTTYENQLLMTKETMKEIEPDIGATRFMEGKPIGNQRRDDGPSNNPSFFSNLNPANNLEDSEGGDTLASLFKATANLRGENTTREFENNDVSDRFSKLRTQYKQDGKLDRPQDASNKVEDVIGKRLSAPSQTSPSAVRNYDSAVSGQKPIMETFLVNEAPERIAEENRRNAEKELILSNQLSNNAYLNYGLIPPEKMNYQTRKYYITVDSLQRDLELYPSPANFQVRFEQPDEVVEVPSYLNANGVVIYKQAVVYQNVGGKGAKLENIYENIVELKCLDAQIPLDTIYVGGSPPYDFNGPKIDENKLVPNQFPSYPYGPIFQANYGINVDVLDEPYYFLVVEEIDGAYDGTSFASRRALAKLNYDKLYGVTKKFVGLKTVSYEGKTFYPTTLAKLSQMTLRLVTRFNQLLNVGIDKVYIKSIEQGDEVVGDRYCPLPAGSHLTKITVIAEDPSYGGQKICATGNFPGDRILFYSIFACDPVSNYIKLNDDIYINFGTYPVVYFYMMYDGVEKRLDIRPFLTVGDLIVINSKYIFDIENIDTSGIYVKLKPRMAFDPTSPITAKGFVKVRKYGNNDQDRLCFLAQNGQRVGGELTEQLTFQVLYPFENIPDYLRSPPYGFYREYEAFYIQAKKQISYTFEVTQVEQNMEKLDSRVIPRG
jgi:hypothetical protein